MFFHRRDSQLVNGVPYAAFHGNKRYALGLPSRVATQHQRFVSHGGAVFRG